MRTSLKKILLFHSCPIKESKYTHGPYKKHHRSMVIRKSITIALEKKLSTELESPSKDESTFLQSYMRILNKILSSYDVKLTQEEKNNIISIVRSVYQLNLFSGLELMLTNLYMRFDINSVLIDEIYPIVMKDMNDTMHLFFVDYTDKTFNINAIRYLYKLKTFLLCNKIDIDRTYIHVLIITPNKINHYQKFYDTIKKDRVLLQTTIFNYINYYKNMPKFNNWLNCNACDFTCK